MHGRRTAGRNREGETGLVGQGKAEQRAAGGGGGVTPLWPTLSTPGLAANTIYVDRFYPGTIFQPILLLPDRPVMIALNLALGNLTGAGEKNVSSKKKK